MVDILKPMKFNANLFATDLLSYRTKHRISRKKLADVVGTTHSVIRHYENKVTLPDAESFLLICLIIGRSAESYVCNFDKA